MFYPVLISASCFIGVYLFVCGFMYFKEFGLLYTYLWFKYGSTKFDFFDCLIKA